MIPLTKVASSQLFFQRTMLTIHRHPKILRLPKRTRGGLFFSQLRKVDDGFVLRKSLSYMNYIQHYKWGGGRVSYFRCHLGPGNLRLKFDRRKILVEFDSSFIVTSMLTVSRL